MIVLTTIFISACSSDTPYTPPAKVQTADNVVQQPEVVEKEVVPVEEPEPPKIQTFDIGDTATDNQLKITVNSVKFVSVIDEVDNQFMIANAPSGKEYAVIDITIENILPDETQMVSSMMSMTVLDQDGYNYDTDFEALMALDKGFKDGEILPTMKKRGQLGFLVPKDSTDLKFIYKFDVFEGTSAVFDIK